MARDADSLLNCQYTKFVCSHVPWALAQGLETHEQSVGLVALGKELEEQLPGS